MAGLKIDIRRVRDWLLRSRGGRTVLRQPVLVVLHSDGWVEVYGSPEVDVQMVVKPHCRTAEGGVLAEQYIEQQVPYRHCRLYCPSGPTLRAVGLCRRETPEQLIDAERARQILRDLRAVQEAVK